MLLLAASKQPLLDKTLLWQVRAGQYETVYSNMPATGLGRVAQLVPIQDQRSTKSSKQRAAVHRGEASAAADPSAGTAHHTSG